MILYDTVWLRPCREVRFSQKKISIFIKQCLNPFTYLNSSTTISHFHSFMQCIKNITNVSLTAKSFAILAVCNFNSLIFYYLLTTLSIFLFLPIAYLIRFINERKPWMEKWMQQVLKIHSEDMVLIFMIQPPTRQDFGRPLL